VRNHSADAPQRDAEATGADSGVIGDSLCCSVCYERLRPQRPVATGSVLPRTEDAVVDRRPIVFPCGHGACADCASRVSCFSLHGLLLAQKALPSPFLPLSPLVSHSLCLAVILKHFHLEVFCATVYALKVRMVLE
jgi:hypothetical protein